MILEVVELSGNIEGKVFVILNLLFTPTKPLANLNKLYAGVGRALKMLMASTQFQCPAKFPDLSGEC